MTDEQRERGRRLFEGRKPRTLYTTEQKAWLREVSPDTGRAEMAEVVGIGKVAITSFYSRFRLPRMNEELRRRMRYKGAQEYRRLNRMHDACGLPPTGRLYVPARPYTNAECKRRDRARLHGYLVPRASDADHRFTFWWDGETDRSPKFEAGCAKRGFTVKEWAK